MTKKTSLLLTALFAVSGILPCYAEDEFHDYNNVIFQGDNLGRWNKRGENGHLFQVTGMQELNNKGTTSMDWDSSTEDKFKNFASRRNHIKANIDYINKEARLLLSADLNLQYQTLDDIEKARDAVKENINDNPQFSMESDPNEIAQLAENLSNKIKEAKDKGIDVSSMNTGKKSPSSGHSSGGGHSSHSSGGGHSSHSSGGSHSGHSGSHGPRY